MSPGGANSTWEGKDNSLHADENATLTEQGGGDPAQGGLCSGIVGNKSIN